MPAYNGRILGEAWRLFPKTFIDKMMPYPFALSESYLSRSFVRRRRRPPYSVTSTFIAAKIQSSSVSPADLFNTLLEDPEGFVACHLWIPKRMADNIRRMAARHKRRRA
jgi:hypothetical protein